MTSFKSGYDILNDHGSLAQQGDQNSVRELADAVFSFPAAHPPIPAAIERVGLVERDDRKRNDQELVQSFMSGRTLLPFASTLSSFAPFRSASSVRGGSPAFSIDLKTA